MLSIIICSINPQLQEAVSKSIRATIGVEYELLVWDNRQEQVGICEAYNRMAEKARYEFLCFCHEDISFETMNWGSYLTDFFQTKKRVGVMGVAGAKYKSKFFSGWYTGIAGLDYFNISHITEGKRFALREPINWLSSEEEVVCIDGVFIACRRDIWKEIRFNSAILKGFHFYDLDFSLRAAQITKVYVTNRIELNHYTRGGDYGEPWLKGAFVFHNEVKLKLPTAVAGIGPQKDLIVAKAWLERLKNESISMPTRLRWVGEQKLYTYPALWPSVIKFFSYRVFGIGPLLKMIRKFRS